MQRFGEKLRTLRTQRHLTMQKLAESLEYGSAGYISDVENSRREPTLKFVLKVAHFFRVTTDQLLNDSEEV